MNILMVNKFFYIKGGSETYYFALKWLLQSKGHQVIDFSMKDEKNVPSPYEAFFVEAVDYNKKMSLPKQIQTASRIIYSVEAKQKLERLIKETKPDLAHLHIFQHQLSPSILDVLKKHRIPVVYTAHDLKMLCLNYTMLCKGQICEACKGGKYINCLKNRCVKDSFLKSGVNTVEGYVHKWRHSYDSIDMILTPSDFYRRKFLEHGVEPERVMHLPNFLDRPVPPVRADEDHPDYFLYFGRLSLEKGIMTLIKAIEPLKSLLYIVGTGPCMEEIEAYLKANNLSHVRLLGYCFGSQLTELVAHARAVVLPSQWYENGPYSAIEAMQLSRPLIGSELGGIPELIDGNGMIFQHNRVEELRDCLMHFPEKGSEAYGRMALRSREIFEHTYQADQHYARLEPVYHKLLRGKTHEQDS